MKGRATARTVLAVIFVALLALPAVLRHFHTRGENANAAVDANLALNRYGFHLTEVGQSVGVNFVQERERVIRQQQEAIRELSTPVLQVRERLLILPIIGVLDGQRARQLTEQLLHGHLAAIDETVRVRALLAITPEGQLGVHAEGLTGELLVFFCLLSGAMWFFMLFLAAITSSG